MKPLAKFFANITKTVSASGVQFLIILCSTPIMTRLYEPATYATFGIINTAASVLIGIGLLSLPNAYCAEKNPTIRTEIIQTMLLLLAGLAIFSALAAAALEIIDSMHAGMNISRVAIALFPLLVLTYGLRQIMVNVAIQKADFNRLSLGQVIEPVTSRGGSIALGATLGGHPAYILIASIIGHLTTMLMLITLVPKNLRGHWAATIAHVPNIIGNLRRYGDFVVFGTMAQQVSQVVILGMQLGIAGYYTGDLAGQYILAVSILTMPIMLVALSTAPVVYHHFIETEKHHPEQLLKHFVGVTGLYLLASIGIMLPIFLFGEEIFRFAFGDIWTHAGQVASTLSIAYLASFVLTGVQSMFMVTRRLRLQFALEVGTCIPVLLIALGCFQTMNFDKAMLYLSLIWLLRSIVLLCAALVAALQHHPNMNAHDRSA